MERKARHMNYIHNLIYSKKEVMKRNMVDLVDSIHKSERKELEENLDYIRPDMRKWQRKCMEPVNYEVFIVNKK